jgi:prophage regulatory protein
MSALPIVPRILRRDLAALYLGMGTTKLDAEVKAGRLPAPLSITPGIRGWDRHDLDQWIEERKAAQAAPVNEWDAVL